jgi:putative transposase
LKVELDWLKKKLGISAEAKRQLVEPGHPQISLRRQCTLLGLARWSWYYQPVSARAEDVELMRLLDEQYTTTPFYGIRRMTAWLHSQGDAVNHTRVRRWLRTMGLEAIDAKPRLSQPAAGRTIYPYLRRGGTVSRVNQVWSADITSIRWPSGVVSLVAVMAWFSRDGLSWAVSITMDVACCLDALTQALAHGQPEIVNPDQGAQFTAQEFTTRLKTSGVRIRMDGRGRALDNVFVERLWRSVQQEEVYRRDYQSVWDARQGLARYVGFYNYGRLHQALGYRTPAAVSHG